MVMQSKKPNLLVTGSRDGTVIMWIEEGDDLLVKAKFCLRKEERQALKSFPKFTGELNKSLDMDPERTPQDQTNFCVPEALSIQSIDLI